MHQDGHGSPKGETEGTGHHEVAEVHPRLKPGVAVQQLRGHARQYGKEMNDEDDPDERRQLGEKSRACGHGQRVHDTVHLRVAFLPDQLPGIEGHDDQQIDGERTLHHVHHVVGHRVGGVAVHAGDEDQRGDQLRQAQRHDDDEGRALQHAEEVAHKEGAELEPPCMAVVPQLHTWKRNSADTHGGAFVRVQRLGLLRTVREAEAHITEQEDQHRNADPDQAVPQQHTVQWQQARVLVRHGPVLGDQVHRRAAKGVQQSAERLVVHVAHEAGGDGVAHEQRDGRDEGGHRGAQQNSHREDDGS